MKLIRILDRYLQVRTYTIRFMPSAEYVPTASLLGSTFPPADLKFQQSRRPTSQDIHTVTYLLPTTY
jgi:hypothetical protein